jgi:hypothetical protein
MRLRVVVPHSAQHGVTSVTEDEGVFGLENMEGGNPMDKGKAHTAFRGRQGTVWTILALSTLTLNPAFAKDYTVTITSTPSGAKVEIDGVEKGFTPLSFKVPPGFVKATHSVFSKKLVAPGVLRLSLPGYVAKEEQLTVGPLEWKNLYGVTMEHYYLFKSTSFHFDLEPVQTAAAASSTPTTSEVPPAPASGTVGAPASSQSFAQAPAAPAAPAPPSVTASDHPKATPLTNEDVIGMVKAGIAEQTILLDIRKGPTQFDTSPAALIELKKQGVPDSILRGMLRADVTETGGAPQPQ